MKVGSLVYFMDDRPNYWKAGETAIIVSISFGIIILWKKDGNKVWASANELKVILTDEQLTLFLGEG